MTREQRRRLLLRAYAAAGRFTKKAAAEPYFKSATDAFVAGWLLGYRAHRRDAPAAVALEREAIAKLCETLVRRDAEYGGRWGGYGDFMGEMTGSECAAMIRALGKNNESTN